LVAKEKILLDTDIGNDIDDAFCLAYLLAQPRCELVGVTTVTGDTQQRAALVDALCQAAGRRDVPIVAGRGDVVLSGPGQPQNPQAEVLDRLPHRTGFPTDAVDFLRETIRKNPGEITLLAIGPMSNIGLLFAVDPQIPSLLKRTVMMIGHFFKPGAEWNAKVDPFAAALVYRYLSHENLSIGLDVTLKCALPAADVRAKLKGPLLEAVGEMAEVWFRNRDRVIFHDPLAAAVIFEPDLCSFKRGRVVVDVHSRQVEGMTLFREAADGPHQVAADVDGGRFLSHFFSVLGGGAA